MLQMTHDPQYKITPDEIIAHTERGEIVNVYRRNVAPLDLWHRHGLPTGLYTTGVRYGAMWRQVCKPKSPPHSDSTRIVVDGAGAAPEVILHAAGVSTDELAKAQKEIGDQESIGFLNRLCGLEDWPVGDKRRFKRKCRKGLEALANHWRRR